MFNKRLAIPVSSTFSSLLAQVDDEGLLYRLLKANTISLQALSYDRDHGPDANEKKAILARLCVLSLTKQSNLQKIKTVLTTLNEERKDPQSGQATTATPRLQVLTFWHEQAKASAATEWLIDAWNAYYHANKSDEDFNSEGSAFALVTNYKERVQNFSVEALCAGIVSDDQAHKSECLEVMCARVMNKSAPELAIFSNILKQDSKRALNGADEIIRSAMNHERHAQYREAFDEYFQVFKNNAFRSNKRIFAAVALAKLGQEHGFTIIQSAKDSTESNYSYLIPLVGIDLERISFNQEKEKTWWGEGEVIRMDLKVSLFKEDRLLRLEMDDFKLAKWSLKKSRIEIEHQKLLREDASFADMQKWTELCVAMFFFVGEKRQPSRQNGKMWDEFPEVILDGYYGSREVQFWQNSWDATLVLMFTKASAYNADESIVKAWNKMCSNVWRTSMLWSWPPATKHTDGVSWSNLQSSLKNDVKTFLQSHPVFNYARARYFEIESASGLRKSSHLKKAKDYYQQLAKINEPMALESLARISDNKIGAFKASGDLARAYLLVNPDCKSPAKYTLKPSMKNLARDATSEVEKKTWENTSDASPEARKIYAAYLAAKLQKWHNNIDTKEPAGKMFAEILLRVFTKNRDFLAADFHPERASNLSGGNALEPYRMVLEALHDFIINNKDLISAEHAYDLALIRNQLEKSLKSFGFLQQNHTRTPEDESWAAASKQFNSALQQVSTQQNMHSPLRSGVFALESKQIDTTDMPAEKQLMETNAEDSAHRHVDQFSLAPPAEEPAALIVELEVGTKLIVEQEVGTNPDYIEAPVLHMAPRVVNATSQLKTQPLTTPKLPAPPKKSAGIAASSEKEVNLIGNNSHEVEGEQEESPEDVRPLNPAELPSVSEALPEPTKKASKKSRVAMLA